MKERKLRFNLIDVLIILLIAAVIFALLYIFVLSDKNKEVVVDTQYTTIRYVVQATGVDEKYDGLIKVGDPVEEFVVRKNIGKVIGVQSEPYQKITFDYEREEETVAEVEGRITMNISIEATAVDTPTSFNIDGCDIRVGQQYSLALPGMYCTGYCIELTPESDK